jgi:ferrous iron transport protein A
MKWHMKLTSAHTAQLLLSEAAIGEALTVSEVLAPPGAPEWAAQLEDIGFFKGERVAIMARGMPGGDPLVVRVGLSTFALRLVEAACVRCTRLAPAPAGVAA